MWRGAGVVRLMAGDAPSIWDAEPERPSAPPPARPAEPLVDGPRTVHRFTDLAALILRAPPKLGPVRLVSVDGRAGSGKSTFAGRLRAALAALGAGVAVLRTDDLLQGWLDTVTFWPRLAEWVLDPLRRGEPAHYRRYDWDAGRFRSGWDELGIPEVLVLDGVSTARAAIRPELTTSVYVQATRRRRFERGVERDGQSVVGDWTRWMLDEDVHFAADRTVEHVTQVVDGDPPEPPPDDEHYVRIAADSAATRVSP